MSGPARDRVPWTGVRGSEGMGVTGVPDDGGVSSAEEPRRDGAEGAGTPDVLASLRGLDERCGVRRHLQQFPPRAGVTAAWPRWADESLVTGYHAAGVEQPWRHQAEAAEALWSGRHTVLATATGSGKSLAVWLPAVSAVREAAAVTSGRISQHRRRPTTLYLAPTKALAADQLDGLERLLAASGIRDVHVGTCDGDTDTTQRSWVREHADVVLTNPDFLHHSLLPGHRRWQRLLRGLRFVVVDECHAYRGVLGAHVALVLRRLLRLARHHGADPVVVCLSATAADPQGTAARLAGVPAEEVVSVTEDTAPAGPRSVLLWQPPELPRAAWDPAGAGAAGRTGEGGAGEGGAGDDAAGEIVEEEVPARESAPATVARLLAQLVRRRHRTLAFVRSRRGTETVAASARDALPEDLRGRVAAYRGGYLPEERRELERALRSGDLLGVATTNALELGVDITGLDAVLIAGWPGSRVSLWQQAGRSGRGGRPGVAVLVAGNDPLEAYLLEHPESVFAGELEATVFDPRNPYVLGPHLCAAAAELPVRAEELETFGLADDELLQELSRRGLLRRRPTGWYWEFSRPERPGDLVSLRGDTSMTVAVVEAGSGTVLGTVGADSAHRTVHPGAVYTHQGRHFLVTELSEDAAVVTPADDIGWRTRALETGEVRILDTRETTRWLDPAGRALDWQFGAVEVSSRVHAFQRLRVPDREVLDTHPLELPERSMRTMAVWWSAQPELLEDVDPRRLSGALHALEHAAVALLPLYATCDPHDLGGITATSHPDTERPTLLVHDAHPGGAGFAERGFRSMRRWLESVRDLVDACPCSHGCPRCVHSPRCGQWNSGLDKPAARALLAALLSARARGTGASG